MLRWRFRLEVETMIAKSNYKLSAHNMKWGKYKIGSYAILCQRCAVSALSILFSNRDNLY